MLHISRDTHGQNMNDAVQLKQEKERGRERKINITKQKQTKKTINLFSRKEYEKSGIKVEMLRV